VRTLIVSDLHLGSASRVDVLRRSEPRELLLEALAEVDRLVLLGDVLELRHGPRREVLVEAREVFEDLGRAMSGGEIVLSAGNHDHALVSPWLQRRGELHVEALGLEQSIEPAQASPMAEQIAAWAAPARVRVSYPGIWVRPDVYAMHGHYLDCHLTVPTLERLGIGAMGRILRRPHGGFGAVEDYEAVSAPVYAWIDAVAGQAATGETLNGKSTVRAWRALGGDRDRRSSRGRSGEGDGSGRGGVQGHSRGGGSGGGDPLQRVRTAALAGGFTVAVAALNRIGLGPVRADISAVELRRAGLSAMGEVAARLGLGEAHVIFGHTHRTGPLPKDDPHEWRGRGGARLMNTGCWTYDAYFLTPTPGESPYWPGGAVLVEEEGEPRLLRLLEGCPHGVLGAG
jgi:hypothetical protein